MNKKQKEKMLELQENVHSYWDGLTLDSIIKVTGKNESFMAIRLPSREIQGTKGWYWFLRLDKPSPEIIMWPPSRIVSINDKSIEDKNEWKIKDYIIRLVGDRYTCTCKGYQFRRKCKHIEEVKSGHAG